MITKAKLSILPSKSYELELDVGAIIDPFSLLNFVPLSIQLQLDSENGSLVRTFDTTGMFSSKKLEEFKTSLLDELRSVKIALKNQKKIQERAKLQQADIAIRKNRRLQLESVIKLFGPVERDASPTRLHKAEMAKRYRLELDQYQELSDTLEKDIQWEPEKCREVNATYGLLKLMIEQLTTYGLKLFVPSETYSLLPPQGSPEKANEMQLSRPLFSVRARHSWPLEHDTCKCGHKFSDGILSKKECPPLFIIRALRKAERLPPPKNVFPFCIMDTYDQESAMHRTGLSSWDRILLAFMSWSCRGNYTRTGDFVTLLNWPLEARFVVRLSNDEVKNVCGALAMLDKERLNFKPEFEQPKGRLDEETYNKIQQYFHNWSQ